tara:strand:- start:3548 stop:5440 length:1893 start_codon:yes stop_codon:yes gene_type:complete
MASPIDELVIKIKADTKQLQGELKKIEGKLKVTGAAGGAAFGGMGAKLSRLKGGAIAATVGFVAMGVAITKIAKVGSQFEDLKDSLDQVFGSMAAGDAAMDKVFKFAQTTPFQIEDATKAFVALKSAGIEPSMDMLQTFADTASVSVDSLGTFEALIRMVQRSASGGMGLEELNMISDRGIDVLGILGEKLNLTKDDIAEYGKTAEGAAAMVKALTEGLNEKFGGAMASKMDNLSTKTSNMVIAFKQLGDELFKSGLGDFLKQMADRLTALANSMSKATRASQGKRSLEDMGVDTTGTITEQRAGLKDTADKAKLNADNALSNIGRFGDRGQASRDFSHFHSIYVNAMTEMLELDRQLFVESIKEPEKYKFVAGEIKGLIDFQSTYKKLVEDTIPENKKLQDQIDYIQNLMKTGDEQELQGIMGFLGVKDVSEMQDVIDHLEKLKGGLEEVTTFSSEMQQTIINASNAFTTDFVNSLMEGENALDSFKNFAKSIVSQIISTFLQMAVVNQILNSVFGLTGTNALPTISLGKKAGGGTVQGGSPYMVGERGPEIFVPHSSGNIMNNMNSKNATGGGGATIINQSINFATGVVPTVRAEVMKMLPQIADVTKGAVAEAAMRGGSYRRMLQGG